MLICTVFSTEAPTSAALMLRGTLFPAIHETDLKQCKTWRLNVSLSFGCVQRATPSTFQSLRGPGPDLPGHQVGRGVLKNTETSIQIACVFIISFYILWSDVLPASCVLLMQDLTWISKGHKCKKSMNLCVLCFWVCEGWWTCLYRRGRGWKTQL